VRRIDDVDDGEPTDASYDNISATRLDAACRSRLIDSLVGYPAPNVGVTAYEEAGLSICQPHAKGGGFVDRRAVGARWGYRRAGRPRRVTANPVHTRFHLLPVSGWHRIVHDGADFLHDARPGDLLPAMMIFSIARHG
jgi:hypothetical protein